AEWAEVEQLLNSLWQYCRHHASQSIALLVADERYRTDSEPFLRKVWRESRDESMMLLWLEKLREVSCDSELCHLLDTVEFQPASLRGELHLLALQSVEDSHPNYSLVQRAKAWRRQVKEFICEECGVEVREMRWQCPQCHQWGSMRVVSGDSL
ncbi:MAG: hypothetical protein Q9M13_00340, partial [Mariprofundales bacterium]|nr:hypothetical protein [Mariprofundales bacterium]